MIDMHSHILPGTDDGPKDISESLKMCDIALDDGIKTFVATPHNLNGVYKNGRKAVIDCLGRFNRVIRRKGKNIAVLPGSDTYMGTELLTEIEKNNVMTINDGGKFLLLELPSFFISEQVKQQIFKLKLMGITAVITHPERNNTLMEDTDVLHDFIQAGVLVQITAGSITGDFGSEAKKNALLLLKLNMAHILASDAHNASSRPPVLSKAVHMVSDEIGAEDANKMVSDTPASLIKGVIPPLKEPLRKKGKRSFMSFFGPIR